MVRLRIPLELWQQISAYARAALPNEVTGIGLMETAKSGTLEVTKIFCRSKVPVRDFAISRKAS